MRLKIVTHEKVVFDDVVDEIYSKGTDGEFGVLKNHIPFMTPLEVGVTKVVKGNEELFFTTMGGIFQYADDEATILTNTSECSDDIDVDRAKCAKERAENRLNEHSVDIDEERAAAALMRATARLRATQSR